MDLEKTGKLISLKRKELGLTQKELADFLCISDRTVSKWEQGAGFPDISLIEPVADALKLSVVELLHGEIQHTAPEKERSARDTLQAIEPEIKKSITRSRKWILLLVCILALLIASIPWLCATAQNRWIESYEISSAEATAITPMILITRQDYQLIEALLKNEKVLAYYNQGAFDRGTRATIALTEDEISHYLRLIKLDNITPDFLTVEANQDHVSVIYGTDFIAVYLNYAYKEMDKTVVLCQYPYRADGQDLGWGKRHGSWTGLSNDNNAVFRRHGYKTGWLELFRTTYY